jgi:hypothetical protein
MTKTAKILVGALIVFVSIIVLSIGTLFFTYIKYANLGNEQDNLISATYSNNQNILGQTSLKIQEVAKVSDKYTEALKEVVTGAITSRYGEDGSQAVMQWITEQNPTVDSAIFIKISQVIESGRNEFQLNQTVILDQCRIYKNNLGYVWAGFWLKIAGYPKADINKMCTPVSSQHAIDSFETGVDKGVTF